MELHGVLTSHVVLVMMEPMPSDVSHSVNRSAILMIILKSAIRFFQ